MPSWGQGIILVLASLIGIPLGVGAGIYLAESGRNKFGNMVRFTADVLNGVPSIVVGIAVYGLIVVRQKAFLGTGGRRRAGNHDDSDGVARNGRNAADGTADDQRSSVGIGRP